MSRKRLLRGACSIGLSFFLSLLIFSVFTLVSIWMGLFNRSMILDKISGSHYYEKSYQSFLEQAEIILAENGIQLTELKEVFPYTNFYITEREWIKNVLYGTSETAPPLQQFEATIGISIADRMSKEGLLRLGKLYKKEITLPFLQNIQKHRKSFINITYLAGSISLAMIAITISVLYFMHRYRHKGLRYVAYSLLGAVYMEAGLGVLAISMGHPVYLEPGGYLDLMTAYQQGIVLPFFYTAAIGLMFFAALVCLIEKWRNRLIS